MKPRRVEAYIKESGRDFVRLSGAKKFKPRKSFSFLHIYIPNIYIYIYTYSKFYELLFTRYEIMRDP